MNNFKVNYNKILEVLKSIPEKEQFLNQKRKPELKDIELIAMNLTEEYMSIDGECQLFKDVLIDLKNKIERSVYNRRKQKLFFAIAFIRNELSTKFNLSPIFFIYFGVFTSLKINAASPYCNWL